MYWVNNRRFGFSKATFKNSLIINKTAAYKNENKNLFQKNFGQKLTHFKRISLKVLISLEDVKQKQKVPSV